MTAATTSLRIVTEQALPGLADEVLTPEALTFVGRLAATFGGRVEDLLASRRRRQARLDRGEERLGLLSETAGIRASEWRVAPLPADLADRRVEITGPVDRKMIINALNSGANVFMADFEDSTCPTWANVIAGHKNIRDAVRGTIRFEDPQRGKTYQLAEQTAVLMIRPRGLHLPEAHVELEGRPVPATLFDLGLFLFHNARELVERGSGPYVYLPKLESHLEARLLNDVFVLAQDLLGLPVGTIKATVLLETLPAAFEMEELLYELRDHSAGLNCGRWDYIFSAIKTHRLDPAWIVPDRSQVGMTQPFMAAYTQRVVEVCHRRGAFAMGGMAAQIPIKSDPARNEAALAKVRGDKLREVREGHDGTWVAHPGLVALAREVFDEHMPEPNQIARVPAEAPPVSQLLERPAGEITAAGLELNLRVGIQYLAAWLDGNGCVPLYHLMEDAATAEISRVQVWQWLHHGVALADGRQVTRELVAALANDAMGTIQSEVGAERFNAGRYDEALELFLELATAPECADFLTLPAYERLVARGL